MIIMDINFLNVYLKTFVLRFVAEAHIYVTVTKVVGFVGKVCVFLLKCTLFALNIGTPYHTCPKI